MNTELKLVADIGATNARFQLCRGAELLDEPVLLGTADYASSQALLDAACEQLPIAGIRLAVIAAAGPVDGRSLVITNSGMSFSVPQIQRQLSCDVHLLNDFYALAHAIPDVAQTQQIGGRDVHRAQPPAVKAVLGPGSGLGMATLVPVSDGPQQWRVVDGEGGHATLPIANHLDAELWGVLSGEADYVSRETVLSGSGLVRLYRAMCAVWGSQPEALDAAQISARGVTLTDPVCHQTLESFCGMLGNAAGDFALTVGARGGVYIAGGIAPQIVDFFSASPLRRRFDERGPMSAYVSDIPIYIVLDSHPGLAGAMRYSMRFAPSAQTGAAQVSD